MNLQEKRAKARALKVQQLKDQDETFTAVVDHLPPLPEHCPPRNDSGDGPEFPDAQARHEYDVYQTALRMHKNAHRDLSQAKEELSKAEDRQKRELWVAMQNQQHKKGSK